MISRLLIYVSQVRNIPRVFSDVPAISLARRRDLLQSFGVSVPQSRKFSTGLATLPATEADAPDDAVLDAWRKELGTSQANGRNNGELSFLLLKNILYWGSVALSFYLIFTVFSFF